MPNRKEWKLDELLGTFQAYLRRVRGTGPAEFRRETRCVRSFVEHVVGVGQVDVKVFSASDVIAFVRSLVGQYRPSTVGHFGAALRSFFRFLRFEGLRDDRLDDAVPSVVRRRLAGLPRYLEAAQLDQLLTSLGRSTPCEQRDRAMVLCVARLGLRASEVTRMRLEDIDWRAGVISVPKRKTGRGTLLPLLADVGQAIAKYIEDGRPPTANRHIFVLHRLRVGEPTTQATVYDVVSTALRRSGIEAPMRGPNLLRHSLATRLIRSDVSLKEIADLMGHQRLETTQIYAKLDLNSLHQVAQPWPEVLS
jgi:site-specific recombinase XerD